MDKFDNGYAIAPEFRDAWFAERRANEIVRRNPKLAASLKPRVESPAGLEAIADFRVPGQGDAEALERKAAYDKAMQRHAEYKQRSAFQTGASHSDLLDEFRFPGQSDIEALANKTAFDRAMQNGRIRMLRR